jgi:hypothetical protein
MDMRHAAGDVIPSVAEVLFQQQILSLLFDMPGYRDQALSRGTDTAPMEPISALMRLNVRCMQWPPVCRTSLSSIIAGRIGLALKDFNAVFDLVIDEAAVDRFATTMHNPMHHGIGLNTRGQKTLQIMLDVDWSPAMPGPSNRRCARPPATSLVPRHLREVFQPE